MPTRTPVALESNAWYWSLGGASVPVAVTVDDAVIDFNVVKDATTKYTFTATGKRNRSEQEGGKGLCDGRRIAESPKVNGTGGPGFSVNVHSNRQYLLRTSGTFSATQAGQVRHATGGSLGGGTTTATWNLVRTGPDRDHDGLADPGDPRPKTRPTRMATAIRTAGSWTTARARRTATRTRASHGTPVLRTPTATDGPTQTRSGAAPIPTRPVIPSAWAPGLAADQAGASRRPAGTSSRGAQERLGRGTFTFTCQSNVIITQRCKGIFSPASTRSLNTSVAGYFDTHRRAGALRCARATT